jgi:hypothetical protein
MDYEDLDYWIQRTRGTAFYNENLDIELYTTIITRICICAFFLFPEVYSTLLYIKILHQKRRSVCIDVYMELKKHYNLFLDKKSYYSSTLKIE